MLASGRPLEPGGFVDLTTEEVEAPHNAMLVSDGNLIDVSGSAKTEEE
jgi:hypothetical protein